jgi:hypothetical protein
LPLGFPKIERTGAQVSSKGEFGSSERFLKKMESLLDINIDPGYSDLES